MINPNHHGARNVVGALWMIAAMAGFAIEDSLLKIAMRSMPVAQVLVVFGIMGAIVFAGITHMTGGGLWSPAVLSKPMRVRVVFEFTGRLFYILALALTTLSGTTVILQATPIVVVAGAALFMGEQVGWRRWSAIALGLIGVIIVLRPTPNDFNLLSLLAVIGMLGFAGRDLASRAAPISMRTPILGFYGFLTLILAGTSYHFYEQRPFVMPDAGASAILVIAVIVGVASYSSLMQAMRTGQVSVVTPFRYIRLPFGVGLGVFAFGEPFEWQMALGSAIIVASGLFILIHGNRRKH